MNRSLVMQKLQILDEALDELRSLGTIGLVQLEDWRTRRAVERNLLILSKTVTDVSQIMASFVDQTAHSPARDAFDRCVQAGALSQSEAYRRIAQFWGLVVHRYETVDPAILIDAVNRRLEDFEQFRDEMLAYVQETLAGEPAEMDDAECA